MESFEDGFAGADESQDLFANRKHGERSLRTGRQGVRGRRNPTRSRARPSVITVTLQEATTVTGVLRALTHDLTTTARDGVAPRRGSRRNISHTLR